MLNCLNTLKFLVPEKLVSFLEALLSTIVFFLPFIFGKIAASDYRQNSQNLKGMKKQNKKTKHYHTQGKMESQKVV